MTSIRRRRRKGCGRHQGRGRRRALGLDITWRSAISLTVAVGVRAVRPPPFARDGVRSPPAPESARARSTPRRSTRFFSNGVPTTGGRWLLKDIPDGRTRLRKPPRLRSSRISFPQARMFLNRTIWSRPEHEPAYEPPRRVKKYAPRSSSRGSRRDVSELAIDRCGAGASPDDQRRGSQPLQITTRTRRCRKARRRRLIDAERGAYKAGSRSTVWRREVSPPREHLRPLRHTFHISRSVGGKDLLRTADISAGGSSRA